MATVLVRQRGDIVTDGVLPEAGNDHSASVARELAAGEASRRIELDSVRGGTLVIELEGDEPAWFLPAVQACAELLHLPQDWNSYGARPIDPAAVASALQLLLNIMHPDTPLPLFIPTNRGGIHLEWHTHGMDLEVEQLSKDQLYIYGEDHQHGTEWEEESTSDLEPLRACLAELAHRS